MVKFFTKTVCIALISVLCMSLNAQGTLSADHRPAHLYQKTTNSAIAETAFMAGTQTLSRGNMAYGYIHYPSSYQGYWKWDVDAIISSKTLITSSMPIMYGGEFFEGVFYCYSDYATCTFYQIDAFTGAVINSIPRPEYSAGPVNALSYDYSTNTMYALYQNGLYTVDLNTGLLSSVANISLSGGDALIMAINLDGDMFMVNIGTANFYSIDKSTGASTLIGSTGRTIGYAQCMSFDHNDGTLYWAESEAVDDNWMTINPATGVATMKTPGAYEITGLHFAFDNGGGPTYCPVVTNLAAEVQGTDVKLTWTAATGSPTGYKVYEGTTELATVTETEYVVTNLSNGDHTFDVAAIYDDGCTPKKVSVTATVKSGNPITNLNGNCADGTLTLTWDAPEAKGMRDEITLQYSGNCLGGIGTNGVCELWPAIRYTPDDLAAAGITSGMELTVVGIAPQVTAGTTFTLKVWQGGNWTTKNPGTELISMPLVASSLVAQQWNDITLTTPIEIDASQELWFGYEMHATSNVPAGRDEGPVAAPSKSNICYDGVTGTGWCTLLDLLSTAPYNWCVRGFVTGEAGEILLSNYDVYQDDVYFDEVEATATTYTKTGVEGNHNYCIVAVYDNGAESPKVCKEVECGGGPETCDEVTGAVAEIVEYCTKAVITWTAVADATYEVNGAAVATNEYTEDGDFEEGTEYVWNIVTVCADGKSDPVEVKATAADCDQSIIELTNSVSIYPNPASGIVTIKSANFVKVEVYNTVGQLVETRTVNTVDVSNYNTGVYFFKVYDGNNNVTKRVMVAK